MAGISSSCCLITESRSCRVSIILSVIDDRKKGGQVLSVVCLVRFGRQILKELHELYQRRKG